MEISSVAYGFSSIKIDYSQTDYPKRLMNRISDEDYVFSIKFRYSDILLKKHKLHLSRFFSCNHTYYCVNEVSVSSASRYITSASRYHPRYQSRSSMYIRGLIPRNFGIGRGSSDWVLFMKKTMQYHQEAINSVLS